MAGATNKKTGAGFIIFSQADRNKVLMLVRDDGQYDIPKGTKDPGETHIATAKRECFEECSIVIEDHEMLSTPTCQDETLTTFIAITDKVPHITQNVHSGIWEHIGHCWVNEEEAMANCLDYLRRHIAAGFLAKEIYI
jgi:8-oxo-dGTP pyrophosphatase MutT (NUDIX family)